jgi:hypothetical protein
LYDVVANARNSVDVDKMDYLQRDWSDTHSCIGRVWPGVDGKRRVHGMLGLPNVRLILCYFASLLWTVCFCPLSHNLGMSTNLKHDRLIRHCRVIQNEICYNSKEVYNLYDLFHTRYSLHKQVYTHRVSKSIEFMIVDVFKVRIYALAARTLLFFVEDCRVASPPDYCQLLFLAAPAVKAMLIIFCVCVSSLSPRVPAC